MDDVIIQFQNFGFQYRAQDSPTLHDISLTIRRGEKVLIAGPSGCGKSTLAHCINGLVPHTYKGEATGTLTLCGKDAFSLSIFDISQHVGTVLQDSDGQFVGLTVAEDIAFALENDCVQEPDLHNRVREVASTVGIATHLLHAPNELSGGQKQRVALAGVLVEDVDLLLFDEPLANLDPATGKAAIELIDRLHRETGAAVVIIEHRLEDVLHRNVDRVVLMRDGRILADTDPDALLSASWLSDNGIREPLYLTALKYAGVQMLPQMHPASLADMVLSEEMQQMVRSWYASRPARESVSERPLLLRVDHIDFHYANGHHALQDISADIHKGEMIAIIGTNGAGKSTFSKVLCGFETQQQGTLLLNNHDMAAMSIKDRADHIGFVMQNPNQMISQVMIFDEIALGLRTRGLSEEEIRPRVEKILHICGLWPFRNWPVSALSFGQKKRVTIASILVLEPEILLLDEPTAGQDYRHYTDIMEFLRKLHLEGMTVIMITHDMHLMLEYAERALVFHDGRIIADNTCASVLTTPGIVEKAHLKETSLYNLAMRCGIPDGKSFVDRFIAYEQEEVRQ